MIPLFFNCFANSYSHRGASRFREFREFREFSGALKELRIKN